MSNVNINWDELGFDVIKTKSMFLAKKEEGKDWEDVGLVPFENIEISPASCVLNYGQGVFEGMKALRTKDNEIVLFRPIENGKRIREPVLLYHGDVIEMGEVRLSFVSSQG